MEIKKLKKILRKVSYKKISVFILLLFFMISCGEKVINNEPKAVVKVEKQEFFIETKKISDFDNSYIIKKSGKIEPISEITLSSLVSGRIKNILIKEGNAVYRGQPIVYISDTIANIGIKLEQAKLGLEKVKITYESNKISLDKQVFDAGLSLKKLKNKLDTLKKDSEQNIKKVTNDLENSKYSNLYSKSSLELEKLDNTIKKQELDYENILFSNEETINGFKLNLKKDYNSILVIIDDIIQFGDNLFGVTNRNNSSSSYIYLGGKNSNQKSLTEEYLRDLIYYRNGDFNILKLDDITTEELKNNLDFIMNGYEKTKLFLNSMEKTINNSIESQGVLSSTDLISYESTLDTYQSLNQANYSAFVSSNNTVNSFLNNYKRSENSKLKQIELLKKDKDLLKKNLSLGEFSAEVGYEKTIIASADLLSSLEIQIETAENNLKNAIDNRNVTLNSLQNSIDSALLTKNIASKEYGKLTIYSPISGIITEIIKDIGHEVQNGTPIIKLIGNTKSEVEISLSSYEIDKVKIGDKIDVIYEGKKLKGIIYSKLTLSDDNLNYKVKVRLEDNVRLVGNIVNVNFKFYSEKKLLPLNIVKILGNNENEKYGEISIYKDGEILYKKIILGQVYGNLIEFSFDDDKNNNNADIIITDVKNYDVEKFILKIKK